MKKFVFILIASICFVHTTLSQQAGDLDPTFGKNGVSANQLAIGNFGNEYGRKILIQPDGRLIVVADIGEDNALVRYNANGTLDKSYGNNGTSQPLHSHIHYAAIQPDGKVLVTGNSVEPVGSNAYVSTFIARYNTNGNLDSAFASNGILEFNDAESTCIYASPQGEIFLALIEKEEYFDEEYDFKILRWGHSGFQVLSADFGQLSEAATSIAVQSDGKIIVSGTTFNGSAYDVVVARFNNDGLLDHTFDGDGKKSLGYNNYTRHYYHVFHSSIIIQSDGKIVVAASEVNGDSFDLTLARFNSTGTLDKTFNRDGKLTIEYNSHQEPIFALAPQEGGKILLGIEDSNLYCFTNAGILDSTFDNDGIMLPDFGLAISFGIQHDGKLLLTGDIKDGSNYDILLARYNKNGTLDSTFDDDGVVVSNYLKGYSSFISSAIQRDGKIVAIARFYNGSTYEKVLARFSNNGVFDLTFSEDGKVPLDNNAHFVFIQPNEKIIVATTISNQATLIRYNKDGSRDQTFGKDGIVPHEYPMINAMCIQPDGKLILVSKIDDPSIGDFAVVRYQIGGSLDISFGDSGTTVFNSKHFDRIRSVALQVNGEILILGSTEARLSIVRFTKGGVWDINFGEEGITRSDLNSGSASGFGKMSFAVDSKQQIIIAAEVHLDDRRGSSELRLGKFTRDGHPDITFTGGGAIDLGTTSKANPNFDPSITLQIDDKIILSTYNSLYRFNPNGILDVTFKGNGKINVKYGGQANIQKRKLFIVGGGTNFPNTLATITSYLLEANKPPSVKLTAPTNNSFSVAPATIVITASASDPDGTISKVEFYSGTELIRTERYAPYRYYWQNVPPGIYTITARAYDNMGNTTTSKAIQVVVGTSALPLVSITAPANNAPFTAPANIYISANASDPDGTVSKVEFYNGATLLGTDATTPYTFSWQNVPAGTYRITAKAYDNSGMVATSKLVTIMVSVPNKAPVVRITAPGNNAAFNAPASISISASAVDPDGTISKVELYNGTTLIRTERYAPYRYLWPNVPAGVYRLTAKAYDNGGKTTVSAPVQVTVGASGNAVTRIAESRKNKGMGEIKKLSSYLEQNLPNPATGKTVIGYYLHSESKEAVLILTDQKGAIVKRLVLTGSGKGQVSISTAGLSGGTYIYSLRVNGEIVDSKRLVVAR